MRSDIFFVLVLSLFFLIHFKPLNAQEFKITVKRENNQPPDNYIGLLLMGQNAYLTLKLINMNMVES